MHISRQFFVRKQAQATLIAAMCVDLGYVALPTALYLQRFLVHVLSIEVHVCVRCDSAVDFTDKKVVSVVVIFKIEVTHDFSVTQQGIRISLGVLSTSRVLEESFLHHATVADGCLHRRVEQNFRFGGIISLKFKCPSNSKNPSRPQSCPAQELCPT